MTNGKSIVTGALAGGAVVGASKLIESLSRKVEAGEPVTLDPETLALLAVMAAGIEETSRGVAASVSGINTLLAAAGEPPATKKIEQIPYVQTLELAGLVGSTARLVEYAPFSGYVKEVIIHWPLGCNQLVDVAVGHGITQFCPREEYLALNDATPSYYFNEYVDDHEELWVQLRNRDGGNPHTIVVTIRIEG